MNVDELEAGPELDRLVGERVMGVREVHRRKGTYDLVIPGGVNQIDFVEKGACWSACPKYSSDIAAAWKVVEKMHASGDCASLIYRCGDDLDSPGVMQWWVEFRQAQAWAYAQSLPLAICRAALKVVGK